MKKSSIVKPKREKKDNGPHWTAFEQKGMPIQKQQEIAEEIIYQAKKKGQYTLLGAVNALKVPQRTFEQWVNKYSIIAEAQDQARAIITEKRFNDAATREASEKLFKFVPQYSQEYKEFEEWQANVKASVAAAQAPNVQINMTDFSEPVIEPSAQG